MLAVPVTRCGSTAWEGPDHPNYILGLRTCLRVRPGRKREGGKGAERSKGQTSWKIDTFYCHKAVIIVSSQYVSQFSLLWKTLILVHLWSASYLCSLLWQEKSLPMETGTRQLNTWGIALLALPGLEARVLHEYVIYRVQMEPGTCKSGKGCEDSGSSSDSRCGLPGQCAVLEARGTSLEFAVAPSVQSSFRSTVPRAVWLDFFPVLLFFWPNSLAFKIMLYIMWNNLLVFVCFVFSVAKAQFST